MSELGDLLQPPCTRCGGKWTAGHECAAVCQCGHPKRRHSQNWGCEAVVNAAGACPCTAFVANRPDDEYPTLTPEQLRAIAQIERKSPRKRPDDGHCWEYSQDGTTVHVRHTPHEGRPCRQEDDGSRGWEATDHGWRCTECHGEVLGHVDAAIDAAHVCDPAGLARGLADLIVETTDEWDHPASELDAAWLAGVMIENGWRKR